MRRRKLLVALAGLAVVVAAVVVVLWPFDARFNAPPAPQRAQPALTFERCAGFEGKNLAEIEAIVGPPGDYRTRPVEYYEGQFLCREDSAVPQWRQGYNWKTDNAFLHILVDENEKAVTIVLSPAIAQPGFPPPTMERDWQRWVRYRRRP
jgi:hypothetical protein